MVKSQQERTRDSEARKVRQGGRRLPGGVLNSDAADALDHLADAGYAASATACIARAITEAAKRRGWSEKGED